MYPDSISGGKKQWITIAHSVAMNPKVMLYDEPTTALGPELVDDVLKVYSTAKLLKQQNLFARMIQNTLGDNK